jgi:hypothetical protein
MLKSRLTVLSVVLLISGCSKRISYQDAYKFDRHVYSVKTMNSELSQRVDAPPAVASVEAIPQPAAIPILSLTPPKSEKSRKGSSLEKQIADVAGTVINSNQRPASEPLKSRNWAAVAGVISTIVGWLLVGLAPILVLPGIIFCIIGLRSEKRKLALVFLCMNIVAVLVGLAILISFNTNFDY